MILQKEEGPVNNLFQLDPALFRHEAPELYELAQVKESAWWLLGKECGDLCRVLLCNDVTLE